MFIYTGSEIIDFCSNAVKKSTLIASKKSILIA